MSMEYRNLGRSGLKVSALSFGSWVTFSTQLDTGLAAECLSAARDAGAPAHRGRIRARRAAAGLAAGRRRALGGPPRRAAALVD